MEHGHIVHLEVESNQHNNTMDFDEAMVAIGFTRTDFGEKLKNANRKYQRLCRKYWTDHGAGINFHLNKSKVDPPPDRLIRERN